MISNETEQINTTARVKNRKSSYYWPFALVLFVYGLDQFSKWLTETNLGPYGSGKEGELLGGLVRFRYVQNTGASFSMLRDQPWLFTLVAAVVSLGIVIWYIKFGTGYIWYQLSTGLILAGAVGNLSDRLFKNGAVTDMINIPWLDFFKNFNVADMSLNFGVAILIIVSIVRLWQDRQGNNSETL